MRISLALLALLLVACATAPRPDDRVDVDASLVVESAEASLFRVVVMNSSERPLTIDRVEVQPVRGASVRGASVSPREVIAPGEARTYNVHAEIDPRDSRRSIEEIGGPKVFGRATTAIGKPTARIYVMFRDGSERATASYKVEL